MTHVNVHMHGYRRREREGLKESWDDMKRQEQMEYSMAFSLGQYQHAECSPLHLVVNSHLEDG